MSSSSAAKKRKRIESISEILVRNCCSDVNRCGVHERDQLVRVFEEHLGNVRTSRETALTQRAKRKYYRYFFSYTWDGSSYKYMRTSSAEHFVVTHVETGEHFRDMRTSRLVDAARVIEAAKQLASSDDSQVMDVLDKFDQRWWPFLLARGAFRRNERFEGILDSQ